MIAQSWLDVKSADKVLNGTGTSSQNRTSCLMISPHRMRGVIKMHTWKAHCREYNTHYQ